MLERYDVDQKYDRDLLTKVAEQFDFNAQGVVFYEGYLRRIHDELKLEQMKQLAFESLYKSLEFKGSSRLTDAHIGGERRR